MPDLSSSSSSSSSSTSDHSDTEEKNNSDHPKQKEDKNKTKEKKKETSYQNPSYDPKQFYTSEDDAQICTIVPIKERKVIFEQLQTENAGDEEGEKTRGGKSNCCHHFDFCFLWILRAKNFCAKWQRS